MIDQAKIKSILPHRFPMLLIDEVRLLEPGNKILAIKNVSCNEPCFAGIADSAKISAYAYPCSLIVESFGQAAGILYNLSLQKKGDIYLDIVMLLGSIAKFTFHDEVFPGETMEHRVVIERLLSDAAICRGEVWSNKKLIAKSGRMVILHRPAEVLSSSLD
jgi:3-hydroxyacyl-[acyl-carrier-protein] dehydratase